MHRAWMIAIVMVLAAAGTASAAVDTPEIQPGAMPYLLAGAAGAVFYLRRFFNR